MALATITICNSIQGLTIAGVKVLDLDEISPEVIRQTPVLFPEPLAADLCLPYHDRGRSFLHIRPFSAGHCPAYRRLPVNQSRPRQPGGQLKI